MRAAVAVGTPGVPRRCATGQASGRSSQSPKRSCACGQPPKRHRIWLLCKEVERPKYLPGHVVQVMQDEGFSRFNMHWHTELWRELDAKAPAKGCGVEVEGYWYWYSRWVDLLREHCVQHAADYR
jgi:hypothetical protein